MPTGYNNGAIDVDDAPTSRTNLGLGTIATQSANNVSITGGSVTGITDLSVGDGGTGRSNSTAYAVICGGTTNTNPHQSVASVGTSGQVLTSNGPNALPTFQNATGANTLLQVVTTSSNTKTSTTTSIPYDDTIPQNTEGAEYMTLSITPQSATSTLFIFFNSWGSNSTDQYLTVAFFQDSNADAFAATQQVKGIRSMAISMNATLAPGSTNATTIKVRYGPSSTTSYINTDSVSGRYSTVSLSYLTIMEVEA